MIRIITDSAATMNDEIPDRGDVTILSLYVNRDGVEYDDLAMDRDAFYEQIADMVDDIPTTSQPSQHAFESAFEDAAVAGDQVLGVFISSGLSGAFDGALRAARAVAARHPGFEYSLIDSTSCGGDEACPLLDGIDAVRAGRNLDQATDAVLRGIESTRFLFTPDSLAFLKAGGRIGNAAAMLGTLVQIRPVLTVRDTHATTFSKVRTQKKALAGIVDQMKEDIAKHGGLKRIFVHYIGAAQPALDWAREVIEPLVGVPVVVSAVSPIIGVHVGPAMGIVYECKRPIQGKVTANLSQYAVRH